jgi:hypothetical protein
MNFLFCCEHGNETDTRYRETWDEWYEQPFDNIELAKQYIDDYNSKYNLDNWDHKITECFQIGEKIYG